MASEWGYTSIGSLIEANQASLQTGPFGTVLKASEYKTEGVPLISVREIRYGFLSIGSETPRVGLSTVERLPAYVLRENDIVFGRKGGVDRNSLISAHQDGWFLGSDGIRLRLAPQVDAAFVSYQLRSAIIRDWLLHHSEGTTMASMNQQILGRLPLILPPLAVQRCISAFLKVIDARIDNLASSNEALENVCQTMFKSWFVEFDPVRAKAEGREPEGMDAATSALFPGELCDSEFGSVPADWKWRRAGEVMQLSRETVNPMRHPDVRFAHYSLPAFDGGRRPVLEFGREIKSNKTIIPSGCILLSKLNPHIPRVWLPPSSLQKDAVCSTEFLVFRPARGFSVEYLFCQFTEPGFAQKFGGLTTGTSNSHQRVKVEYLLEQWLIAPNEGVLEAFTSLTHPLFEKINANIECQKTLSELRDALLPRLISGKLLVPEAEKLVEAVL